MSQYELETRTCACGCERTWRALPTSPNRYFCKDCEGGGSTGKVNMVNWGHWDRGKNKNPAITAAKIAKRNAKKGRPRTASKWDAKPRATDPET
jgi:hypothetical protein